MKFADFLNNLSTAMGQHKTATQKLTSAMEEVNAANDQLNTAIASFGDIDLGEGNDFQSLGISDYVELQGIANANPITEIMSPIRSLADLFHF
jgi:hypothetical protein